MITQRSARFAQIAAIVAVLAAGACACLRPLNANDLFWHLAAGRQILATGQIPSHDAFSFASDSNLWIDHEWLWQVAHQAIYRLASGGRGPEPDWTGCAALIVAGGLIVLAALLVGLREALRRGTPAVAIAIAGFAAVEIARERLMVRPETASLLALAVLLALLAGRQPGMRRGLQIGALTGLWANIHPAALLAPFLVLLHAAGESLAGAAPQGRNRPRLGRVAGVAALEAGFALVGTLANPYGYHLWSVPFKLAPLVRTGAFFNPEWLRPPFVRFPVFWIVLAVLVVFALLSAARRRGLPSGPICVALALFALGAGQMRHMGLAAVGLLFALPDMCDAASFARDALRPLSGAWVGLLASGATVVGGVVAALGVWIAPFPHEESGVALLDPGRFPVAACEAIAREAPDVRLYNDVAIGGYLIWRFHPPGQVFIDGRNELYTSLLPRLGRIHTEGAYDDWKKLIAEMRIGGAIVTYKESKKGILYPPSVPGGAPVPGYRAWSAYLFPVGDWALVAFDDSALIFMKRGGPGQSWIDRSEYTVLNLEDREFLMEKAARDPEFAARLRAEAERRIADRRAPRSLRAESFLGALMAGGR